MKILINLFACCTLVMLTSGCSSFLSDGYEQKRIKDSERSLAAYESTLNPADYDQEVEIVEKTHVEEKKQRSPLEIPKDNMTVEEETAQGFRIQIFSSSGVDEASMIRDAATEKFSKDSVYIIYDAPVYKVRVGDFLNRFEANQRLPEFSEKGYRDAWIVPDRIIQRKALHLPAGK